MKRVHWIHWLLIIVVMAIMNGCGGGGGTVDTNDTTDTNNTAPVANSESITTAEDTAKSFTLSGTDTDGDSLSYTVTVNPSHGTLSGTAPDLTYTPAANFHGSDYLVFKVNDGTVDSAEAYIPITVTAANDAPVATPQTLNTDEDSAMAVTLSGTDADGDTLSYTVATQPSHGTLSGTAPDLTYTPDHNFHGSDTFYLHGQRRYGYFSRSCRNDHCHGAPLYHHRQNRQPRVLTQ